MAWDEFVAQQASTLSGYLGGTFSRWAAAAVAIRSDYLNSTSTYQLTSFFEDLRWQVAYNMETLEELTAFPGFPVMPTVPIIGRAGSMHTASGEAFVRRSLVGATVDTTDLIEVGGAGGTIGLGDVTATIEGELKGKVSVKIDVPVGTPGTYRGVLRAKIPPRSVFEPLAWIVAIANP